ncbi:DUF1934 domain-containing protein [Sporohalobacter salinus]|uniref:DUF1934 domain-containing protein n=1 Tax=Sporohalobacter salinus TaxID=1494606 RepID=UPI00195F2973|nr:DUF1934 domain-containing protein [Sporohalobacter salinus]MBM7622873.1 uncharacterized beta-barrel protein YwiB (DUF1934 family) [Sporohalobacter salinus]
MQSVVVNVESIQIDEAGKREEISFTTNGKLYQKKFGYYLRYDEEMGIDQETTTTLKIKDEVLTLIREGAVRMKQEFEVGKVDSFSYQTPYGRLDFNLIVEEVYIKTEAKKGRIKLDYNLKDKDKLVSQNQLTITYKEVSNV